MNRIAITMIAIAATAGATACGGRSSSVDHTAADATDVSEVLAMPLRDTRWQLIEIMGQPVAEPGEGQRVPFIQFDATEDRVYAWAGCNNMSGQFEHASPGRITISRIASTMMACDDMTLENQMNDVLTRADSYIVVGNELQLHRARMAPLARFVVIPE